MLTILAWKWGALFSSAYVLRLQAALDRHVAIPHELVVVTDNPAGLVEGPGLRLVPMPTAYATTPRCRRRMQALSAAFARQLGATRILAIDLDVVIVDDLTPLVSRRDPICGYRVGHAGVYSGSFLLFDAGALDEAWQRYREDPVGYPKRVQARGTPSDQAMINHWLDRSGARVHTWTEADGLVTYYGKGYERLEHWGVGPRRPALPAGARIVILGSADKSVMDRAAFPWVVEHWGPALEPAPGQLAL